MKELIQKLASSGDEIYGKICEVIKVHREGKMADLQPLDGSSPILGAYLMTDDAFGGVFFEPQVGSFVTALFITKEIAVVVNTSGLEQIQMKIQGTEFQIDEQGFLLKKENETLKKLMKDLIKAIKKMKFTTNMGPTIKLINESEFTALEKRFNQFLKDH